MLLAEEWCIKYDWTSKSSIKSIKWYKYGTYKELFEEFKFNMDVVNKPCTVLIATLNHKNKIMDKLT